MVMPYARALLLLVDPLVAMIREHMQYHVFGHPHGKVGIDDADHRHVRQLLIRQDVVDAGAERKHRLEVAVFGQQSGRWFPDTGVSDVVRISGALRPETDVSLRGQCVEELIPVFRVPADDSKKDCRHQYPAARRCTVYCATTPSGAVSMLNAAAKSARV